MERLFRMSMESLVEGSTGNPSVLVSVRKREMSASSASDQSLGSVLASVPAAVEVVEVGGGCCKGPGDGERERVLEGTGSGSGKDIFRSILSWA